MPIQKALGASEARAGGGRDRPARGPPRGRARVIAQTSASLALGVAVTCTTERTARGTWQRKT